MKDNNKLFIFTFYRFVQINNKKTIKNKLDKFVKKKVVRGTILIANEGLNGSISGTKKDLIDILNLIKKLLKIRKLTVNMNESDFLPFNRIKIRLKKETVSLGKGKIDVNKFQGTFVHPSKWNKLIKERDVKLIDTRNIYEIPIGKFKRAINPDTNSFREFPKKFNDLEIKKDQKIAIYCTGGIRCEKASAFLKSNGYKNVMQLEGGILNYLEYVKRNNSTSLWMGECFVFDERVTVNKKLSKGKFLQCHGCRNPITKKDTNSKYYEKGVSCPYCYNSRNSEQKKKSYIRQQQINHAERKQKNHPFKTITLSDFTSKIRN